MSAIARALVSGHHQRLLRFLLWCGIFGAMLLVGYGFILWQVSSLMHQRQQEELQRTSAVHQNAIRTLRLLNDNVTGIPCSQQFRMQMLRVAFLPDGLNEFLYAPDGRVQCSTSQIAFNPPISLGQTDVVIPGPNHISWRIQRNLEPIGLSGAIGSIAQLGNYAVAIPPYAKKAQDLPWLKSELVAVSADKSWHLAGKRGLYAGFKDPKPQTWNARLSTLSSETCDEYGLHCVASKADLFGWANSAITILASTVVLTALFAWILANNILSWLRNYWSFEARFLRCLNAETIAALYQPIIDLKSDKITAIEVLARWKDVDDTLVSPAKFIDIVAKSGRTAEFTQLIADRAFDELMREPLSDDVLEINFNVFACDFDCQRILKIFSKFLEQSDRFCLAIELIEFHEIDFDKAQATIEALSAHGVRTYIDDFGTGYSSIERVARLAVDGVKLDRSFAMSPPDSIMGRMLVQVIEMVKLSDRSIIVEGVETQARLELLRSTGMVEFVQGYGISPPVNIAAMRKLLADDNPIWKRKARAA
ncbi:EAL domain-containing protein [Hyphomicrobium sulfonivorans]|uniref:EAL domain-containing protein n=1 Tax=Hyphomicrobium sulfonivorans TaxID=121290 RepID=UPI0015706B3B|nr:EAL domain-containing protein [Hyphomicrobium sulfonivorans]MBI1648865.1 EAL domain-containing protein [Hyphomicrobium sulfonivorans]NSL70600.1 hypothetical protein [Hyphomicrobium sulfonivorans]